MIKWFVDYNLVIIEINIMKFITKNSSHSTVHISLKKII